MYSQHSHSTLQLDTALIWKMYTPNKGIYSLDSAHCNQGVVRLVIKGRPPHSTLTRISGRYEWTKQEGGNDGGRELSRHRVSGQVSKGRPLWLCSTHRVAIHQPPTGQTNIHTGTQHHTATPYSTSWMGRTRHIAKLKKVSSAIQDRKLNTTQETL